MFWHLTSELSELVVQLKDFTLQRNHHVVLKPHHQMSNFPDDVAGAVNDDWRRAIHLYPNPACFLDLRLSSTHGISYIPLYYTLYYISLY